MELGLRGRRALITGGSRGIGFSLARGFLAEGCDVAVAARDETRLETAIAELRTAGAGRVEGRAIDLAVSGHPEALAAEYRDVDILVNNAGATPGGDIFAVDEARWRAAFDLKVFGYVNLTRAMYGYMRGRGPKVIINIIGLGGEIPTWAYVCGNSVNMALMGVTRSLGGRSIDDGIRVVGVNPGAVETDTLRRLRMARAERLFGDASRWREVVTDQPLGRTAKLEEVTDVVVFLASDRAAWITGTVITIDGGARHRGAPIWT